MCTVTVVPNVGGYRVACNRDERDSRPIATAPERHDLEGRVAVFPRDPQSGGTWVGVNDAGLVLAVLNRNDDVKGAPGSARRSRGLIIPLLLGYEGTRAAIDAAHALDPASYRPFHLIATEGTEVAIVSSDGREASSRWLALVRPLLFTSSGLGDALVEAPRRELFERTVLDAGDSWLDGQARFHRHRWPDRPEVSVWMERAGARTVSRSVIDVRADGIDFHYEPLDSVGFPGVRPWAQPRD